MLDFHMHPVGWVPDERRLSRIGIPFERITKDMDGAGIEKGLVMLLDENWFNGDVQIDHDRLYYCALFDIGRAYEKNTVLEYMQRAARTIKGIKIHPTLQRASMNDYCELATEAANLGLFTVVHADGDAGVSIAEHLAPLGVDLIVAHSGGVDFSRIVCLADTFDNVMLDLSNLSLPKMRGLLKWGIEVLGAGRFLFGSDYPYCNMKKYKENILNLLNELPPGDTEKIMGGNAQRLLEG